MNSLIKLKNYIKVNLDSKNKIFDNLKLELEEIDKMLELSNQLKNSSININLEVFDDKISEVFNEESLKIIENIDKILNELKNKEFDLDYITDILNDLNIKNKKEIIFNLSTIKNIFIMMDESFDDENLKLEVQSNFEKILNQLKTYKENKLSEVLEKAMGRYKQTKNNILEIEKLINDLEKYDKLFDLENILLPFDSAETMNNFFKFVGTSGLEECEIIEIIESFLKYNFKHYQRIVTLITSTMEDTVENNKEIIYEQFRNAIKETIDEEKGEQKDNKILELTEEEEEIYKQIKQLIEKYTSFVDEDDKIFLEDSNDFSLESRKKLYLESSNMEWSLIILDIRYNLLPYLEENRSSIFEIFKAIIEKNKEIDTNKKVLESKQNELKELKSSICDSLIDFESDLKFFDSLNDSQKKFYNTIIKMIKESQNDQLISKNASSVSRDVMWFKNLMYLLELKGCVDLINECLNNVDVEQVEELMDMIRESLRQYIEFKKTYLSQSQNQEIKETSEFLNIEDRKNLIIFNLDSDEIESYDHEMKVKLKSCIDTLYSQNWAELRKNDRTHMIANIRYNTVSGYQKEYNEKFEPYRIKMKKIDDVRIGLIKIAVCPENVKKIKNRYGLKYECNSLFFLIKVIKVKAENHFDYKEFNDYIRNNIKYLNYLSEVFGNPNTKESELFKIIDENININLSNKKKTGGE